MEMINRNPKIFVVGGKARHGKDTFSSFLKEEYEKSGKKVLITYLGKYIKYYAREITGWDLSEENKPRELLQQLGTELIREKLGKYDLYVKRMIDDLEIFSYFYDIIIVSDARLKYEFNSLREVYPDIISVMIYRPDFDNGLTPEQKLHATEIDLDDFEDYNYKVINTTFDSLKDQVKNICKGNE